jgi:hypothetical protein
MKFTHKKSDMPGINDTLEDLLDDLKAFRDLGEEKKEEVIQTAILIMRLLHECGYRVDIRKKVKVGTAKVSIEIFPVLSLKDEIAAKAIERDPEVKKWEQEVSSFRSMRRKLLKNPVYSGKFVAIKNGEVVDCDSDKFALAKRVNTRYPKQVVAIAKVSEEEPRAEMPSPEFCS